MVVPIYDELNDQAHAIGAPKGRGANMGPNREDDGFEHEEFEDWGPRDPDGWLALDPLEAVEPEPPYEPEYEQPYDPEHRPHRSVYPLGRAGESRYEDEAPTGPEDRPLDRVARAEIEFDAWRSLPRMLRRVAWREREIAAAIATHARVLEAVPGAYATGVTLRDGMLKAVVFVDLPEREDVPDWALGLIDMLTVDTRIGGAPPSPPRPWVPHSWVPLVIERRPPAVPLAASPDMICVGDAAPGRSPVVRSGDAIAGVSPAGLLRPGTLTGIGIDNGGQGSPVLISARHVVGPRGREVVTDDARKQPLGTVVLDDSVLDAATVAPSEPLCLDTRLRRPEVQPNAFVLATSGMAVQMCGAVNGHSKGYVMTTYQTKVGAPRKGQRGAIEVFGLKTTPGDSGALLVTGHDDDPPISPRELGVYGDAYVDALRCAGIGMLALGPSEESAPVTPPTSLFVPMSDIQISLGVRLCTRR